MVPAQLTDASFAGYPAEARALAVRQLALLRELPLALLPILLRELIGYDWKLPAERRQMKKQIGYLTGLPTAERAKVLTEFRALVLDEDLEKTDWVNHPAAFMEKLTAWLWATHRMDDFRAMADRYTAAVEASAPEALPAMPRLGIVVIGAGVKNAQMPLFRKLRPHGVLLTKVVANDGVAVLTEAASRRAESDRSQEDQGAFRHWQIEGGIIDQNARLVQVSYAELEEPRSKLLSKIQQAIAAGGTGPEELRSLLARMQPAEIGLGSGKRNDVLSHFQLSLLTEGAGAQIFATTFVQWATRECVRRAEPETLLVRYTPRQKAQTMNEMIGGAAPIGVDPEGSLADADMGAYYTWLNLRRLSGASQLRFLVWFEGQSEAIAIGPGLPEGTTSDSPMTMKQVVGLLG